jgi:hypothetical protein
MVRVGRREVERERERGLLFRQLFRNLLEQLINKYYL